MGSSRAHSRWTPADRRTADRLKAKGMSYRDIARSIGRTHTAVLQHFKRGRPPGGYPHERAVAELMAGPCRIDDLCSRLKLNRQSVYNLRSEMRRAGLPVGPLVR